MDSLLTFTIIAPLIHDVAIVDLHGSKNLVGQGFALHLNLTAWNHGDFSETVNITVHANQTIIGEAYNINLTSRNFTIVPFSWATTGFAEGNYTIGAFAEPVAGETDTLDNSLADGWVFVTISGDINGDTYVNIEDAVLMGVAFGAQHITNPSDPRYCQYWRGNEGPFSPNNDINCDGYINIKGAVIQGTHFGEGW